MLGIDSNDPNWLQVFGGIPSTLDVMPTDPNDSDQSTAATVGLMSAHARQASYTTQVQSAAVEIWNDVGDTATERQVAEQVWNYVKKKITFVEDEAILARLFQLSDNTELLITPDRLLTMPVPMGDCDDFSTLTCSLLMALGIQCDFVTIAADMDQPDRFSHVFCEVTFSDGTKMSLDTSHGKFPGWESPRQSRRFVWRVFNEFNGQDYNGRGNDPTQGNQPSRTANQKLAGF